LFKYETCPLKHFVRTRGWLPICRERKQIVYLQYKNKRKKRALRYFTFCAVGAVDVLMLESANIIKQSSHGFNNVFFFDRSDDDVIETRKRIPGANGFTGDFIKIMNSENPDDDDIENDLISFEPPESERNTRAVREKNENIQLLRQFKRSFPFDIINLDLEEFIFKPNDDVPGKVINALRKVFEWQKRELIVNNGPREYLDSFSFMFTTQIGPPNIQEDHIRMLQEVLEENLASFEGLQDVLVETTQFNSLEELKQKDFALFFLLSLPKVIAKIALEKDWYINHEKGIQIFEFERSSQSGPYKILHFVMDVKRQNPPEYRRVPSTISQEAQIAYKSITFQVFRSSPIEVSLASIPVEELQADLIKLFKKRKQYFHEDDTLDQLPL